MFVTDKRNVNESVATNVAAIRAYFASVVVWKYFHNHLTIFGNSFKTLYVIPIDDDLFHLEYQPSLNKL